MVQKEIDLPKEYKYKYIAAFLTMRCNFNCSFCLNSLDKGMNFNRLKFKEIIGEEWVKALNKIESQSEVPITLSGGEPFLHKDFIYIINNIKPELKIDILTNLQWGEEGLNRFIREVSPQKINRNSLYPSIRVSYHPEQMRNAEELVKKVKKLKDGGFNVGIYSILYPSPEQLSAINQMQFRCRDAGIDFRLKEFTGTYKGEFYGDYSKYPGCISRDNPKSCECKTSELLIGPNGNVYRCHRDLYTEENFVGNILDENFEIQDIFRKCVNYGQCHPCDVKVKTNYKQQLGHTSVEIKDID